MNNLKNNLRKHIKSIKKNFTKEELLKESELVIQKLSSLEIIEKKDVILSYWSLPDEVYTVEYNQYLWERGKKILLPSVVGDDLVIRYFEGIDKMVITEPFGIKESVGKVFDDLMNIDVIFIPGIAFDRKLRRLGRGKGYYDRFLPKTKGIKIGLCFDFQLLDEIPYAEHDVLMDMIVTQNEIIS